jgi:(1->4)-alpha-D-glucan 1-alpha-D-glucosylmutase
MSPANPAPSRVPVSTYRLQFQRAFTFRDAAAVVPYLARLGITDCYASPYLMARPGSLHGYDICDHNRLNPELGDERDYAALAAALRERNMGQILDFVPNHMGIDPMVNAWWRDVLENGPSSPYARYFDIDWNPVKPELVGKILLPILGDQYGSVLERGELRLALSEGAVHLDYGETRLPINPRQSTSVLREALPALRTALSDDDPDLREFLSIITELQNLPPYTETSPERIAERQREKEVARDRLARLLVHAPRVRRHLEQAIDTFNGRPGDPSSFDQLHDLLENQAYRLAYWRTAAHEINYRRFFDVNDLAGLRMENPDVFAGTHALLGHLVASRAVTGLRIDHPDGLFDPGAYFAGLQALAAAAVGDQPASAADDLPAGGRPRLYVVIEKVLSAGEDLPEDWPVDGTTGYDFLNTVNGLFVAGRNAAILRKIYARFTGQQKPFGDLAYEGKTLIMETALASELNVLAHALNRLSEGSRLWRDYTLNSLRAVLQEVVACLSVYRTYVGRSGWSAADRERIESALAQARRRNPAIEASIFAFLRGILLPCDHEGVAAGPGGVTPLPRHGSPDDCARRLEFAMKVQQYTGSVQAKGVEDTAFYRYNQLISLNEVGGDPARVGRLPTEFHDANEQRLARWPLGMLATSTHDAKVGEDARARLDAISELPDDWRRGLAKWVRTNAANRTSVDGADAPDRNDEYRFYQVLLGTWPPDAIRPARPPADYVARVRDYMLKAVREAKVHTSWVSPNTAYDAATSAFVERTLTGPTADRFLPALMPLLGRVAQLGMINSLAQLVLKATSPGVPDFYQGTELWDLALVDPDNRRTVDYRRRVELLDQVEGALEAAASPPPADGTGAAGTVRQWLDTWPDGRIKLYVTACALRLRRAHPGVFLRGTYEPLRTHLTVGADIVGFARRWEGRTAMAVVPRLAAGLVAPGGPGPIGVEAWQASRVLLDRELAGCCVLNRLTGETLRPVERDGDVWLPASDIFRTLPVAILWVE